MLFSSPRFFVFVTVLLGLLSLPVSVRAKKSILTAASCLFYAAWDYRYLGLLALVSVIDYVAAARIHTAAAPRSRRMWLALSVASNLGILAYFKYTNFFLATLAGVIGREHPPMLEILLPAGISFYTFKSMSYTIDVFRSEIEPCASYLDYAMFITFFPELIAGPIVRASVFLPQMDRNPGPNRSRVAIGLSLFLLGLAKKRLLADRFAQGADPIFAHPEWFSGGTLAAGALCYAMQIYCDFSGYSDMAIGTAKLIGYDLPENFSAPYISRDITEFWRRWHITLSSWLRDYLYVPLGGNRRGALRTYVNLAATMLLGGLWHGAGWNFVVWGALHGGALAMHRFLRQRGSTWQLPAPVSWALTFVFVCLCWIPFRAATFSTSWTFVTRMLTWSDGYRWIPENTLLTIPVALGLLLARRLENASVPTPRWLEAFDAEVVRDPVSGWSLRLGVGTVLGAFSVTMLLGLIWYFAAATTSPFIYFQF